MSTLQLINGAIVLIGIPAAVASLIYIGRKLQILDSLGENVVKIKHNLSVVTAYLIRNHEDFDHRELQATSPIQLTTGGTAFIREIGFDNVLNAHKQDFFTFIDGEHPKLKYDVETAAIKSIYALSGADFMGFLKVFFYNNPSRSLENAAPTLGVYVRDQYLEAHPEITQ